MNILILVGSFPPIVNSAARLYSELAESLREMGHSVTVISEHPAEDSPVDKGHEYYSNRFSRTVLNGVYVLRISPLSFLSKIPGGKPLRFFLSCLLYTFRGLFTRRPDVILVYSPPLYMGISGYIISKFKKTRFVFNMQDVHPKVLFDSGVIKNRIIKSMLTMMEEICYRNAHSFIVYSSGNREYLVQRGVDREVFVIPNWIDTTKFTSSDSTNSFRNEIGINDKFVVSYAGSMGKPQGLEVIVEAAKALMKYNDILFLLAGEGPSKQILKNLISERKVSNVLLLPVMLNERYVQFLNAADVCLITLSPDIPQQTVPGKLADIMACGRPIIAAVNQQGDAAGLINEAGCGFCVDPSDAKAFSQAVLRLYRDENTRKEMGARARAFAEQYFSRTVCTKHYEEALILSFAGHKKKYFRTD